MKPAEGRRWEEDLKERNLQDEKEAVGGRQAEVDDYQYDEREEESRRFVERCWA
jgi:hypothetical protein